jgi:hypothetical protein
MKRVYIIPTLMVLLFTTCEDRKRSNPFDPEVDLDAWAPSDLQVFIISDSDIKLTWTQEEERISGFRIDRKAGSESFTQIAQVGKDVTEYTDTGLNYGTDYTYRVKAFSDENESGYAMSNTTTMSIPSPSNLTATPIDDQSIQLTWVDNCVFENGYRLERSEDGVSFTQITEVGEDVTEYTDTGLTFGTDYTYRVKAFTDENESGYAMSNTMTMSIPSPSNLTATPIDDQSIQLTWSDNCGFESGFRLERSDGGSYAQIAELGANITEYTDIGLNYGTDYTYTYRVKAFTDDNESDYTETTVNFWQDCEGEWGGSAVEDCNGDCDGTAFENECGCVGGSTGMQEDFCYGCANPNASNYDPNATIDDGSCIYPPFNENFSDISDWTSNGYWSISSSNNCLVGNCALSYDAAPTDDGPHIISRYVQVYAGQTMEFYVYIYSPAGNISCYINNSLVWSKSGYGSEYASVSINVSGNVEIKFNSNGPELSSLYLDELSIE